MRKLWWLLIMVVVSSAFANEVPIKFVNTLAFQVKVKPTNDEEQNAIAADLYVTRFPESGWVYEGACRVALEDNDKTFSRTVKIPGDGVYFFTSRGVDAVGKAPEPLKGEAAQVKVIVDTLAPKVQIIAPSKNTLLRAGEIARIEWLATDQNLALMPISLYYATDGANWKLITEKLPNTGHFAWEIPATEKIYLQINAVDSAGNIGKAFSPSEYKIMAKNETQHTTKFISSATTAPEINIEPRPLARENPSDVQANGDSTAKKYLPQDNRTATKYPNFDANNGEIPTRVGNEGKTAYIAYVMAGNLVRQGRLKDSLRYFRSAVDVDPNFSEAWNDMALVYRELGAFTKADMCIVRALKIAAENPRYLNTRGLIYQAAGLDILRDPASSDESLARANDLILFAVKTYGQAVDGALRSGTLAERAETYFHLGEICYFANQDPTGARQYWLKILELHSPSPELDEVMLDKGTPHERLTQSIYEKNTELWVNLQTWQKWAREFLRQLNDLERGVSLPRSPFGGAEFQQYAHPAMGANTMPQASMPETLSLMTDGSYATTTPGYTMIPQPQQNQTSPQVQVINNYANAPVDRRAAQNEGYKPQIYPTHETAAPSTQPARPYQQSQAQTYQQSQQNNGYNNKEGYYPQSATPQGKWYNNNYGGRPDYTYQTPRARNF